MGWKKLGPMELLCGLLMLLGVVLCFVWVQLGGFFVGLGFGLYFASELQNYFLKAREKYTADGLFTTLMSLGVILYLLRTIPVFVLAALLGFVIMTFVRWKRGHG